MTWQAPLALLAALLALYVPGALGQPANTANINPDVPHLMIGRVMVRYLRPIEGAPSRQEILADTAVNLHRIRSGYTAPIPGGPSLPYQFNEHVLHNARFSQSALRAMEDAVRQYVNDQGLIGVFVYAADANAAEGPNGPEQLNYAAMADNEKPMDLQLVIVLGTVKDVKTIDQGPRVDYPLIGPKTDPVARMVRENSPIQPGQPIDQAKLQAYVARLNRQAGRHIDATLAAAQNGSEGDVDLDYIIRYDKPWTAFVQTYNGGTKKTNEWQERFGFLDNELTGHDDIFSADFNTASFASTYTIDASYDVPIAYVENLRGRVYGTAGRFNSSDIAIPNESLTGDNQELGGELVFTVGSWWNTFFDVVGGAKVDTYFVDTTSPAAGVPAGSHSAAFLLPYVGARVTRTTDTSVFALQSDVEFDPTTPDSPSERNLIGLGRIGVDRNYIIVQANASDSFYIEPLLQGWDQRDTQSRPTAANEVYLSATGQFTPSDKVLAPELETTVGGLYTVRGYPSSIVSGDSAIYGTAEYRLHVPRLLSVASANTLMGYNVPPPPLLNDNGSFYYQPRATDLPGDWDFIVKGFIDGGYVHPNKVAKSEVAGTTDAGLVSIGTGAELRLRDNLTIMVDYGVALTPIHDPSANVDRGASRVDISATLQY